MAESENQEPAPAPARPPATAGGITGDWPGLSVWLRDHFFPTHSKTILIAAGVLCVLAAALLHFFRDSESRAMADSKALGPAYLLLSQGRPDSAEAYLKTFTTQSHRDLTLAKAWLLLGKSQYLQGRYAEALTSYGKVDASPRQHPLISSGALHGMAACRMQTGDRKGAAETLEQFVNLYMKRTGDPRDRALGKEPIDLSPAVPNALWKLALCRFALADSAAARSTAQKLVKVYPGTNEAGRAEKLLALLGD